jgi:hypothetical protein
VRMSSVDCPTPSATRVVPVDATSRHARAVST